MKSKHSECSLGLQAQSGGPIPPHVSHPQGYRGHAAWKPQMSIARFFNPDMRMAVFLQKMNFHSVQTFSTLLHLQSMLSVSVYLTNMMKKLTVLLGYVKSALGQ